jgi:hypothetical protein
MMTATLMLGLGRVRSIPPVWAYNPSHRTDGDNRPAIETEVDYWFTFTEYGVSFLDACGGPSKSS